MTIQDRTSEPSHNGNDGDRSPKYHAPVADPMAAVLELGRIVLGETPLAEVFARVAEVAKRIVPGADEVSVTLVRGDTAHTAAATGELAVELDAHQYEDGLGPCLLAARTGKAMLIPDVVKETRWPLFAEQVREAGMHCTLSVALPLQEGTAGAFNIYSRDPHGLDGHSQEVAEHLAGYAAVAMTNASLYNATARLAEQMEQAMASRAVIEQAKGIVMGERRCSEDEAFAMLAKVSQDANRKLRDVAAALVEQARGVR